MLGQIVIGTVCDTPQLAPSEREQKFQIGRRLAVEAQLFRRMVARAHLIRLDAKCLQPVDAVLFPVCKPLKVGSRFTEELKLHLLELSGTESKVTRCDLVTERFTDLTDTKRDLFAGGSLYVLEVYKDTLCSLRTQIYGVFCILGNSLESLEHQVKLTNVGEIMLAAARTADVIVINVLFHLLLGPAVYGTLDLDVVLCHIVLDELICTETLFTALAVHQRVREAAQMSGCHPCLGVHENRTVYTYVVRAFLNKFLPPCTFYIVFQFYAQIAVVPCIGKAAVNLRTRIYKSS